MSILREIRALPGQIEGLAHALSVVSDALGALLDLQKANPPQDDRLQELELSRARWEAEIEGLMLKAESTYKASAASEARARTMVRNAEKLAGPFDPESEELQEAFPDGHAEGSEEVGLQPMRVAVAPGHKENALRFKFG